ncbi:acetylglutamate semialdehyde dehydrogenase [Paenibacillus sp. S33]
MSNVGLSPHEYLKFADIDDMEEHFNTLSRLNDEDLSEYKKLLINLEKVNKKEVTKTKKDQGENNTLQKGKALEKLVSFLWEKSGFFEVHDNIRNSTNEIDQLVDFNFKGKLFESFLPVNRINSRFLISECKNYNKTIGVTWVGKLYSLTCTNSSRFGFLFSYHGMAARGGWDSAIGLTKKLFLQKERLDERVSIIDFNIEDFRMIAEGHNFLYLMKSKIDALLLQTSVDSFISKHPAED